MASLKKESSFPSWIKEGHNRTGLKLIIVAPEDFDLLLQILDAAEQQKFQAITDALAAATPEEQESFKLALAEILGYVALLKYCGAEKVRKEVKDKITANPKFARLVMSAVKEAA